ncbi:MAG: CRISPR-associated helicase Cas3', partial [Fusobacteriaceae bacterium]|nr:CRISPR-associated helicase Cas3' [Fusobacteriaceae bacterium]
MSNFSELKTTKQLISESVKLSDILPLYKNYLAHSPHEGLLEHTELTAKYLDAIVAVNKLDIVIDRLINGIIPQQELSIKNWVKKLFVESIVFHDLGKVNVNYQVIKLNNTGFNVNDDKIKTNHSLLGAYLFLVHNFEFILEEYQDKEKFLLLYGFCSLFCFSISNHHNSEYDIDFSKNKFKSYIEEFIKYVDVFIFNAPEKFKKDIFCSFDISLKQSANYISKKNGNGFHLWCLLKLQYSLLTASDYYATNHYKSSRKSIYTEDEFGIITNELSDYLIDNFNSTKEYNQKLVSDYESYLSIPMSDLQVISNDNLLILRQKLGAELIEGIKNNLSNRVFYIEAPTGGGKTNLSMLAVTKLLECKRDEITKIFYVFPFTTLITQTHTALKETFALSDKDIIQLHSKAGFHTKNESNSVDNESYDNDKQNYIDYLFINYPICLLSHIKFFDIIKSNDKDINYILYRLANSVVIIDELQSYSPSEWDKLKYFISNYAETFNIRFIIMSATLPKIHGIDVGTDAQFEPLIRDVQSRYLQNPNFKDRIAFDFSLIDKYTNISVKELAYQVILKSSEYAQKHGSVHTIIEFIYKKSTTEFFEEIQDNQLFPLKNIVVLSGTILEPRRKEIIGFLKDSNNRSENILLITTQVVEAGVDIDMDLGFKNISLLDNDEQLAGRINRNAKKEKCCLYLFKKDMPFRIYKNDFRYNFSKSLYDNPQKRQQILESKDFKLLYDLVLDYINDNNKLEFTKNFKDYISYIDNLQYDKVNEEFKLINNDSVSFFVPLNIKLKLDEDGKSPFFSTVDIEFLEK